MDDIIHELNVVCASPPENLIGQAQSGSGKTATFTLAMLYRVDASQDVPQALCVAPTRELARQIIAVVNMLGKFTGCKTFLAVPGNDVAAGAKVKEQIVVGTPGRVEAMIKKRSLDTRDIKVGR